MFARLDIVSLPVVSVTYMLTAGYMVVAHVRSWGLPATSVRNTARRGLTSTGFHDFALPGRSTGIAVAGQLYLYCLAASALSPSGRYNSCGMPHEPQVTVSVADTMHPMGLMPVSPVA